MTKIIPSKKLDFSTIKIGDTRQVHAMALASFKSRLSKFNKDQKDGEKYRFSYSDAVNNFTTATRVENAPAKNASANTITGQENTPKQ